MEVGGIRDPLQLSEEQGGNAIRVDWPLAMLLGWYARRPESRGCQRQGPEAADAVVVTQPPGQRGYRVSDHGQGRGRGGWRSPGIPGRDADQPALAPPDHIGYHQAGQAEVGQEAGVQLVPPGRIGKVDATGLDGRRVPADQVDWPDALLDVGDQGGGITRLPQVGPEGHPAQLRDQRLGALAGNVGGDEMNSLSGQTTANGPPHQGGGAGYQADSMGQVHRMLRMEGRRRQLQRVGSIATDAGVSLGRFRGSCHLLHREPSLAFSTYTSFSREDWAALRFNTPMTLAEPDLAELRGTNEALSMVEVEEVYLPLSRFLNLHVAASRDLARVTDVFLGRTAGRPPYVIGIAGSVAVGKSTTARVMRALLARWPDHPTVDLVTTDGFLYPNAVLEERGLMHRKGFPESYDVRRLVQFVADVKAGVREVAAPVYSHLVYDVVEGGVQVVDQPDVLILEGLNVLQGGDGRGADRDRPFVSDFFDFSIYVDADEEAIRQWFLGRFRRLRETAFRDPKSFFRRYAEMAEPDAIAYANRVWDEINGQNLRDNIEPTKERAHLILEKGPSHEVRGVKLRQL